MDILQFLGSSMHAYGRGSEAYAAGMHVPAVALWALLIAAGAVLLEWVVARLRARR